jgi:hypothetical protein
MAKSLFSGKLTNGVTIEVLEAESFSGKTEFAVKVGGEVALVSRVDVLRNNDIQVRTSTKAIRIKAATAPAPVAPAAAAPTLGDVK